MAIDPDGDTGSDVVRTRGEEESDGDEPGEAAGADFHRRHARIGRRRRRRSVRHDGDAERRDDWDARHARRERSN